MRFVNEKQSSISYSMWTLVKTNCVANQKPKLPSKALNSNVCTIIFPMKRLVFL